MAALRPINDARLRHLQEPVERLVVHIDLMMWLGVAAVGYIVDEVLERCDSFLSQLGPCGMPTDRFWPSKS